LAYNAPNQKKMGKSVLPHHGEALLRFTEDLRPHVFSHCTVHKGAFCQFPFRLIYYYGSNKSTGRETGKIHLCAVDSAKGQLISKCLFGIFNSPKKRMKEFDFTTMVPQIKLFSFLFFLEN
jgi:hypothetical protein